MIQTSQSIGDAPYGDHFTVEGIWDVEQDSLDGNCCFLRIYINVAFSKKTIFRGKTGPLYAECSSENHIYSSDASLYPVLPNTSNISLNLLICLQDPPPRALVSVRV